ncbi:hypothetical protein EVG20_g8741 [Dentipellis fragilis]|uniref:Uncharacterized protein n=1 Tax=Dentipellis fragilis TaxID=205917 RepID=A0A4Y9Y363_9AGAM|nr:hypothetical protein EVG20_g8741 [Dentipellis fragilis]
MRRAVYGKTYCGRDDGMLQQCRVRGRLGRGDAEDRGEDSCPIGCSVLRERMGEGVGQELRSRIDDLLDDFPRLICCVITISKFMGDLEMER